MAFRRLHLKPSSNVLWQQQFFPAQASLLGINVNRGQTVCVRLRPPEDRGQFYPFESILGTLLHELTHNVVGPHNASFYKLLDEITLETEQNMVNGAIQRDAPTFVNAGKGTRLGGSPMGDARSAARQAAERRQRGAVLSQGSGQRLGGQRLKGLTPREAAVMAAERRLRDAVACGTDNATHDSLKPIRLTRQASDAAAAAVAATSTLSAPEWACCRCSFLNSAMHFVCSMCEQGRREQQTAGEWACQACTLMNREVSLSCDACDAPRLLAGDKTPKSDSVTVVL